MIESYEERNWWEYPRIFAKNFWYKYKTDPYFEEKVDLIVSRVLLILAAVAFAASTGGLGMIALAVGTIAVSAVSGFFRMRKIHKLEILEVKARALEKFAAALECRNRLIDLLPGKSKRDMKSIGSREAFNYSGLDKKQKSHGDRVLSIIRDHVLDKVSSVVMIANQGMLIGEISSAAQFLFSGLKEAHARAKSGDRRKYNASVLESLDKRFNLDSKLPVDKLNSLIKEMNYEVLALKSLFDKHRGDINNISEERIATLFQIEVNKIKSQEKGKDQVFGIEKGNQLGQRAFDNILQYVESMFKSSSRHNSRRVTKKSREKDLEEMKRWSVGYEANNSSHKSRLAKSRASVGSKKEV